VGAGTSQAQLPLNQTGQVIWKGLSRLTDIEMGFLIGAKLVGN
jgi:hypothetical protein